MNMDPRNMVTPPLANGDYDVERIRRDFPILARRVHGKPFVYLDRKSVV